ncbi:MAG: hypothetical protein MJE77_45595 [Proteobacteria bacterium]|nr:hypothetical protein [Pseudomonadota bacterium]
MMTKRSWIVIALASVLIPAAMPQIVSADKRIVVLGIEGRRTNKLRRAVEKLVRAEFKVISARRYRKAARRLDAQSMTPNNIARVATRLKADGVLAGTLAQESGSYILRLRLHAATDGKSTKRRLKIKLNKPRLTKKLQDGVAQWLAKKVAALPEREQIDESIEEVDDEADDSGAGALVSADDAPGESEPDPEEAGPGAKEVALLIGDRSDKNANADPDPGTGNVAAKSRGSGATNAVATVDDDDNIGAISTGLEDKRDPEAMINLAVGASFFRRTLDFSYRANFAQAPDKYTSPLTSGVYATGELYPLAHSGGFLGKFGIGFVFDRAIGLKTAIGGNQMNQVDTTVMRYGGGLRFRYRFGSKITRPTVTLGVGFGQSLFEIDRAGLAMGTVLDVPDTKYTYIDSGLWLRIPIGSRIAFSLGGSYLAVLSAGSITEAEEYGTATITGGDAGASLEVRPIKGVLIRVSGSATIIGFDFTADAVGAQSNNRDGDPMTKDVGGALDLQIGGSATLGYMF